MADPKTPQDDKSINDLLKEYASDVKTNDLDDFLKDSGEDEAFESVVGDEDEDEDDNDSEEVVETAAPRKSSAGLLTMLLIIVAFGAAGTGAWIYLNRDEGMTSIMGGFMGAQDDTNAPTSQMPPPPPPLASGAPTDVPAGGMPGAPMPDAPAQPMPITNEPVDAVPAGAAADPALSMPQPTMPAPAAIPTPAPALVNAKTPPAPLAEKAPAATAPAQALVPAGRDDASAQDAVSDWSNDTANTDPAAKLPEKPVTAVKAKPVAAPKQAKKTEPLMDKKTTASAKPAASKNYVSGMDGALPPPFVAIQAKKGGAASTYTPPAAPTVATKATGGTVDGDLNSQMPSAMMKAVPPPFTPTAAAAAVSASAEPGMRVVPLAINGGKSVPDNGKTDTSAYAEIPDTDKGTAPAPAAATPAPAPAASAPAPAGNNGQAGALVAQAQAAEASGDKDKALSLYEQALEADAVYADGKSIDRGAVYDRIGAIKSAR